LPYPTNPDPMVRWLAPFIFPTLAVTATYSIAILSGFLHILGTHGSSTITKVRIVGIPPGEAPEDVRQAWLGVVLPLAPGQRGPVQLHAAAQNEWQETWFTRFWRYVTTWRLQNAAYLVSVDDALIALEKTFPDAAHWFKRNRPEWCGQNLVFQFSTDCCEPVHG
jgi:hypothetical protein